MEPARSLAREADPTISSVLEELPARAEAAQRVAGALIGESEAVRSVRALIRRLAPLDATVLLTGESGTGKGKVAQMLRGGRRAEGPFVAVNCSAIPEHLLESELFGHERGAFTDAVGTRAGLVRAADGGVLFLDEVDALPLPLQAKLLRALDQRTVRPVGSSVEHPFDARIVAATNEDLASAVELGRFRRDLYFRLKVLELHMPPLRERGWDILLLAQVFIHRAARHTGRGVVGMTEPAAARLLEHSWPGNVRELENCILRAVALSRYDRLTPAAIYLQRDLRRRRASTPLVPLEVMELAHLARIMSLTRGNIRRAAELLGISPRTLRRQLSRFDLEGHGRPEEEQLP